MKDLLWLVVIVWVSLYSPDWLAWTIVASVALLYSAIFATAFWQWRQR